MVNSVATARKKPKNGLARGTTGYAIDFFRRDILVNLQIDLKRLEREGIEESVCSKIKLLLSALTSAASAEPKGSLWGPAVYEILREYEQIYARWNDVKGYDENAIIERDRLLSRLQDIRQKLSNAHRKNAHSLSEAHDLQLISAIHDALIQIIEAVPNTFTALAKSAGRFQARAIS